MPSTLDNAGVIPYGYENVYRYENETGTLLYEKLRDANKNFPFRRPDGNGGFIYDLNDTPRVIYHLPSIIAEHQAENPRTVFITEGEKDADNLTALGLVSTTAGSSSDWKSEFAPMFAGLQVVVCEDNDSPGRKCAARICRDLSGIAASVRLLTFRDQRKRFDISDWLDAGSDRDQILAQVKGLPEWVYDAPAEPPAKPVRTKRANQAGMMPDAELQRLTDKFLPAEIPMSILSKCTDSSNAELLCHLYGDRLRFDHKMGRWLVWSGHWWQEDPDGEPPRLALEATRTRYFAAERQITDLKVREAVARYAVRSEDRQKIAACLEMAKVLHPITDAGEGWDSDPYLFGVANGVLNLRTGELRDGRHGDRITRHSPIAYDPAGECPRWLLFLSEVFEGNEGLVEFMRLACGLTLTGDQREQVFFVLHGKGANGKGVLIETIRHIMGPDYALDSGFEAFALGDAHPESLAAIAGKRMVTSAEVREKSHLNEQRLKTLSHGDTLSARHMYGHRFEFKPACKIWLSMNHKPSIGDDSLGFWRSVRLIPFQRQFTTNADPHLLDTLRDEAPGILAWAVQGCLKWQEYGLTTPDDVTEATNNWRGETDPLIEFIGTRCVEADVWTPSVDLWTAYLRWAEDSKVPDRERLSRRVFGIRFGEAYKSERRYVGSQLHRGFGGIGLLAGRDV